MTDNLTLMERELDRRSRADLALEQWESTYGTSLAAKRYLTAEITSGVEEMLGRNDLPDYIFTKLATHIAAWVENLDPADVATIRYLLGDEEVPSLHDYTEEAGGGSY